MATTAILQSGSKSRKNRQDIMYSAIHFRSYMRRLKAACEAFPAANKVMNSRNPISKFLLRRRSIKTELTKEEIPSKEQIFEDPRKYCKGFLESLEERLEKFTEIKEAVEAVGNEKERLLKDINETKTRIASYPTSGANRAKKDALKADKENLK